MKLLFISDIHGSDFYFSKMMDVIDKEQADQICLLGDLLYHGPRNPLPKGYDPKLVIEKLNGLKASVLAVRGNCDSEVDQMVLEFPIMADYGMIFYNGRKIFMSHGHVYNPENLPQLEKGDCFISGHTHIALGQEKQGINILNPGSISLPKMDTPHSYGLIDNDIFQVKTLDGDIVLSYALQ